MDRIYTNTIPINAPTGLVQTAGWTQTGNTLAKRWTTPAYPYLVKYENIKLTSRLENPGVSFSGVITSTPASTTNLLTQMLLPKVSDATTTPYTITVTGSVLVGAVYPAISASRYILDRNAGSIMIFSPSAYAVTSTDTPLITFWRYEGQTLSTNMSVASSGAITMNGALNGSTGQFSAGIQTQALGVTGPATVGGILSGTTGRFNSGIQTQALGVTGPTTMGGALTVGGTGTFNNTLTVKNTITLTPTDFGVTGNTGTYYPIVFDTSPSWQTGEYRINIQRSDVHLNGNSTGSLSLVIEGHATSWGNSADYMRVYFTQSDWAEIKVKRFISEIIQDYRTTNLVIYLIGGLTYKWSGYGIVPRSLSGVQWISQPNPGDPQVIYGPTGTIKAGTVYDAAEGTIDTIRNISSKGNYLWTSNIDNAGTIWSGGAITAGGGMSVTGTLTANNNVSVGGNLTLGNRITFTNYNDLYTSYSLINNQALSGGGTPGNYPAGTWLNFGDNSTKKNDGNLVTATGARLTVNKTGLYAIALNCRCAMDNTSLTAFVPFIENVPNSWLEFRPVLGPALSSGVYCVSNTYFRYLITGQVIIVAGAYGGSANVVVADNSTIIFHLIG
jgi:hypothetical protein